MITEHLLNNSLCSSVHSLVLLTVSSFPFWDYLFFNALQLMDVVILVYFNFIKSTKFNSVPLILWSVEAYSSTNPYMENWIVWITLGMEMFMNKNSFHLYTLRRDKFYLLLFCVCVCVCMFIIEELFLRTIQVQTLSSYYNHGFSIPKWV